jgi:hypothetical protein
VGFGSVFLGQVHSVAFRFCVWALHSTFAKALSSSTDELEICCIDSQASLGVEMCV